MGGEIASFLCDISAYYIRAYHARDHTVVPVRCRSHPMAMSFSVCQSPHRHRPGQCGRHEAVGCRAVDVNEGADKEHVPD